MKMTDATDWKRAVVHLECAADSLTSDERIENLNRTQSQFREGKISAEQFSTEVMRGNRDVRIYGTAIFCRRGKNKYLITARHVLWDSGNSNTQLETREEDDEIFRIIFRVPSLKELRENPDSRSFPSNFLMNLGAGAPSSASYTFSSRAIDLAVISLGGCNLQFARELEDSGFVPIDFSRVVNGPSKEGSEVLTVGFPGAVAIVKQEKKGPAEALWSSTSTSLPVWSFGRVAMLDAELPFFWADMNISPGNSGGPVIENGSLVGVILSQARIPLDEMPSVGARIPFAKIAKAKFLQPLLDVQDQKDAFKIGTLSANGITI